MKNALIWIFAFVFTVAIAAYQRMTGPTYPVRGKVEIASNTIKYQLLTSATTGTDTPIFLEVGDRSVAGEISYKRFKSNDSLTTKPLRRVANYLIAFIPRQPMAGKVAYKISLIKDNQRYELSKKDVVMRYKGSVPAAYLIPHILFIFMAMLFSTITGLEAIFKGKKALLYAWITVITLLLGGLILGPIVQKYSFGAYWTGWPFGHDLTDNKSLVAFIFWIIALIYLHKNREKRVWPVIAALVLLVVFLIPHSVLGSEIDYTKEQPAATHGN